MAAGTKLKHANGTEVTAQEAYDAFMNTRVLLVRDKTTYEAISMLWYDNNSAQTDPTNVGYVQLSYVENYWRKNTQLRMSKKLLKILSKIQKMKPSISRLFSRCLQSR